jgi:hypothetical protein
MYPGLHTGNILRELPGILHNIEFGSSVYPLGHSGKKLSGKFVGLCLPSYPANLSSVGLIGINVLYVLSYTYSACCVLGALGGGAATGGGGFKLGTGTVDVGGGEGVEAGGGGGTGAGISSSFLPVRYHHAPPPMDNRRSTKNMMIRASIIYY